MFTMATFPKREYSYLKQENSASEEESLDHHPRISSLRPTVFAVVLAVVGTAFGFALGTWATVPRYGVAHDDEQRWSEFLKSK